MRIAWTFSESRGESKIFRCAICFCLGMVLRGALLGLPVCFARCVGFIGDAKIEMLAYIRLH